MRRKRGKRTDGAEVAAGALKGALAGAAAVWAMDQVDWFLYNRERPETRARTTKARPRGLDPAHALANTAAEAAGRRLRPAQPHPAGLAVHYGLGIGAGALYGAASNRLPAIGTGWGLLYGAGVFLIHDEAINSATGLAGRPTEYPWQDHARGLVAHLVYGAILDAAVRAMNSLPRFASVQPRYRRRAREYTQSLWERARALRG